MYNYYLTIVLAPLAAAIIAGLAGKKIGRAGAHWVTIIGVGLSCALSLLVLKNMFWGGAGLRISASTPGQSPTACAWRSASLSIA